MGGSVTHGLVHAWPSYAAYAISFLTIGIIWVNHHTVFRQIARVDRTFLFDQRRLPDGRRVQPVPDARARRAPPRTARKAAAFVYGLTTSRWRCCYGAVWFYAAIGRRLIAADADQRIVSGISRSFLPGSRSTRSRP